MTTRGTRGRVAARIIPVEHPGLLLRGFHAIGRRLFGRVPTPEKLMAHRPALMVGADGLYGAIEWCGSLDARLRVLRQPQVAPWRGRLRGHGAQIRTLLAER